MLVGVEWTLQLGLLASCLSDKSMTDDFFRQTTHTIVTSALESTMWVPLQRMCVLVVLLIFHREVPNAPPRETRLRAGTNEERGPTGQFLLWLEVLRRDGVPYRRQVHLLFRRKNHGNCRTREGKRNRVRH